MYSDFMSWMMKTILGIFPNFENQDYEKMEIAPYFFKDLTFAEGFVDTKSGKVSVKWKKTQDNIDLAIEVPNKFNAFYNGQKLNSGINKFKL